MDDGSKSEGEEAELGEPTFEPKIVGGIKRVKKKVCIKK